MLKQLDRVENGLPKGLAAPARRALSAAGIQSLKQLTAFSEKEVAELHGIGPNAVAQLRRALHAKGMSFAKDKTKK
jgi:DNA repair protein RadC